jgi:hypothetical protein
MTEADRPQATFGSLLEPSDLGCMNCSGNNFYNNQNVPVKGIINHWGAITDTSFIVPSRAVPILSIHGTNDGIVPYHTGQPFQLPIWPTVMGSYEIKQRMNHIHATNILYPLYGAGHEPEILTSNVYLDTMYQQGEPFLYELIRPHTGNISGPVSAHQTETQTYSVASHHGSLYCWEVTGGAITGNSGNQINIRWDSLGIQTIKVREKNYLNASGDSVIYIVNISPLLYTNMPSSSNNVAVYPNPVDKVLTTNRGPYFFDQWNSFTYPANYDRLR